MKTAATFTAGTAICALSIFAGQCFPGYEWYCGWLGASIYVPVMKILGGRR